MIIIIVSWFWKVKTFIKSCSTFYSRMSYRILLYIDHGNIYITKEEMYLEVKAGLLLLFFSYVGKVKTCIKSCSTFYSRMS